MSQGWQQFLKFLNQLNGHDERSQLLGILMTQEERSALSHRVEILCSLMAGTESQRELAARLGVSIATITRGSNNLKHLQDDERALLNALTIDHPDHYLSEEKS